MREQFNNTDDPAMKYRYDFKNFFTTVFIQGGNATLVQATPTTSASDRPLMEKDMQVWVQKELLDKDFANIKDVFPIGFPNIYATIKEGGYAIDLSAINKTFR